MRRMGDEDEDEVEDEALEAEEKERMMGVF